MENNELPEEIYEMALAQFEQPEEVVYYARPLFPKLYPIRYLPYDLETAAIDAIADSDIWHDLSGMSLLRLKNAIVEQAQNDLNNWEVITLSRVAVAAVLNNYGGQNSPFCPN